MIFVRSGTSSPDFTPSDLTSWYEDLHIPAVLATRGVTAAARYQLVPSPAGGDEGSTNLVYLTVYHLPDMDWLHSEDCEFWRLPLDVPGTKEGGERRSIFEVAEFETMFWDLVGREDRVNVPDCNPGLCNTPQHGPRNRTMPGDKLTLATGPFKQLILGCLNVIGHNEQAIKTLRGYFSVVSGGPVRCGVFKVDESRPCPPSARGRKDDVADALFERRKGKNFCFVRLKHLIYTAMTGMTINLHPLQFEYSAPDANTSWATPSNSQRYTLLSTFGDFPRLPFEPVKSDF